MLQKKAICIVVYTATNLAHILWMKLYIIVNHAHLCQDQIRLNVDMCVTCVTMVPIRWILSKLTYVFTRDKNLLNVVIVHLRVPDNQTF